jgi:nicotinamidase-related amidase
MPSRSRTTTGPESTTQKQKQKTRAAPARRAAKASGATAGAAKRSRAKDTPENLHGNVPDTSAVALLLVDWINDLEFDGGEDLLKHALPAAKAAAALKKRCRAAKIPCIYANDNFGRWRSDFAAVVKHCQSKVRGRPIAELLAPTRNDYFILKPKHSGFYNTTLELLLHKLEAKTLIISGVAGNICVLFTANDAYMRDYKLVVPPDCTASENPDVNDHALGLMRRTLKAELTASEEIDLRALARKEEA